MLLRASKRLWKDPPLLFAGRACTEGSEYTVDANAWEFTYDRQTGLGLLHLITADDIIVAITLCEDAGLALWLQTCKVFSGSCDSSV